MYIENRLSKVILFTALVQILLSNIAFAAVIKENDGSFETAGELAGLGLLLAITALSCFFFPVAVAFFAITAGVVIANYLNPKAFTNLKNLPLIGKFFRSKFVKGMLGSLFGIDIDSEEKISAPAAMLNIVSAVPFVKTGGILFKISTKMNFLSKTFGRFVGKVIPKFSEVPHIGRVLKSSTMKLSQIVGKGFKIFGRILREADIRINEMSSRIRLDNAINTPRCSRHSFFPIPHLHISSVDRIFRKIGNFLVFENPLKTKSVSYKIHEKINKVLSKFVTFNGSKFMPERRIVKFGIYLDNKNFQKYAYERISIFVTKNLKLIKSDTLKDKIINFGVRTSYLGYKSIRGFGNLISHPINPINLNLLRYGTNVFTYKKSRAQIFMEPTSNNYSIAPNKNNSVTKTFKINHTVVSRYFTIIKQTFKPSKARKR